MHMMEKEIELRFKKKMRIISKRQQELLSDMKETEKKKIIILNSKIFMPNIL